MSRQAIALLIHRDPGQVNALIGLLENHFDIYVHIDKKSGIDPGDIATKHVWKTYRVLWGGYDMVRATFFLYDQILATHIPYSHIILLSGDTLPVKSPAAIAAFLDQHPNMSFIENVPAGNLQLDRRRFFWHSGDFARKEQGLRKLKNPFRIIRGLQKLFNLKRSTRGYERTGSQWTILSLTHARHLVANCRLENYRFMAVPDESVVQNHFTNHALPYSDNLIYAHWPPNRDRSPEFIDEATLRRLIAQPYLFARKFHPLSADTRIHAIVAELTKATAPQ